MADLSRILGRLFAGAGRRPAISRYAAAMLLPLIALALTASFSHFTHGPYFPLFSLAVVTAAVFGGTKPGLLAVGWGVFLNAYALPPAFSLRVSNPEHLARLLAFALVGSVMALLIGAAGRLQQKLDLERERLYVTLRSIGDAVVATDAQGRITFMNPAAEEATGWKQGEALGRELLQVFNIVNERTRMRVENPVEKVIREGRVVGLANHTILIRRDGSDIPIDDSAAPILNAGQLTGVVLVFRDVTATRLNEVALLRAEKLASVGRLAATIAHEINNPLEAVANLLYLISCSDDVDAARSWAGTAQQELARAAHVSKQTLSFARQAGQPEVADIATLADDIVALFTNKVGAKKITIAKRYRGEGTALAPRSEIRQVISNLLSNAIDAQKTGGQIDIRAHTSVAQHTVRLTVADRGCGISASDIERIYEPFFTTKPDVGTGLGLWVTKQILEAHGAHIRMRSRVGRGTVFSITWPLAETAETKHVATAQV